MATILSYLDIDLSISPETIGAICFVLAINGLAIGAVILIGVSRDRRIKVQS